MIENTKPFAIIENDQLFVDENLKSLFSSEEDEQTDDFGLEQFKDISEAGSIANSLPSKTESQDKEVINENQEENFEKTENADVTEETDTADDVEDEDYTDYTNAAKLAIALKDSELFTDLEVNKDLKAEQLLETIENNFRYKLENIEKSLEEKYQNIQKYVELYDANRIDLLDTALQNSSVTQVNLNEVEDDKFLENIIALASSRKGIIDEDIKDLLEVYKDKGILREKAIENQHFLKQIEDQEIEYAIAQKQQEEMLALQQQEEYLNSFKTILDKDVMIKSFVKDPNKILEAVFKPTEIVEFEQNGKKYHQKVPKYNLLYQDFTQDIQKQILFVELLLNGFSFDNIQNKIKANVNKEIINALDDKAPQTRKQKINNWIN